MKDKVFFDSNIIVYLFDKSEPTKQQIAKELILNKILNAVVIISAQVINEFVSATTKKVERTIPDDFIIRHLNFFKEHFIIKPVLFELSYSGLKIRQRYKFSYYDSLIIASAIENGCNILYSEDMQHKQVIDDKLTIINPFI